MKKIICYCDFCGKSQDDVNQLISGPKDVMICNECVDACQEIITEKNQKTVAGEKA